MKDLRHVHDEDSRATITAAAEQIARVLLERDFWRTSWRVEIDGCVYKFKIEGYPKWNTPRWHQREAEKAELLKEEP